MFNQEDLQGVEEQQDRLGGVYTLDSGVYDGIIKLAYVLPSAKSQSKCVVTVIDYGGIEVTQRTWILTGDGKPTYEKNGKKFMLPGYEQINDLCLMSTGLPLTEQTVENKTIKVWDANEKKEVEKSMPVITSILGKPITAGILKVVENKQEKVGDDYVDTNEKREINEVDKYFHTASKKTTVEFMKKVDLPEADLFYTKWKEKNTGVTRDNFKAVAGPAGQAPGQGSGAPKAAAKSLFG